MKEDQRNGNNGRDARRSFFKRYPGVVSGIVIFVLTTSFSIGWWSVKVWANGQYAIRLGEENKKELDARKENVYSIPHIDEALDEHVEDFKDFRNEQRSHNKSFDGKLDDIRRLIQNLR